jgi:hypothetical protein
MNNSYLEPFDMNAMVAGIGLNADKETVLMQVSADFKRLFPNVVLLVNASESSFAEFGLPYIQALVYGKVKPWDSQYSNAH